MTDFDSIWRTQDEIRTVVNAVLGECIWNLSYNERRMAIELELAKYLEEEEVDKLIRLERNKVRVLHVKRELPFLRIPRVLFFEDIYRGKTYLVYLRPPKGKSPMSQKR